MKKNKTNPVLSVLVTTHKEGLIAHKTILSLQRALKPLESLGVNYEIIIHIDNGNAETVEYFDRYLNNPLFRIFKNSFGNPADSRNFAAQQALGKYVSVIDGDDLITDNWFIDSYNLIEKQTGDVILRPKYQLQFGGSDPHHNIWIMNDSYSIEEDALIMTYYNRWPNAFFTTAEVLQKYPFKHTSGGFGYEDWLFNTETRAAGIPNLVVPNTTLFYRRRQNSVTSDHFGTVLPYSPLFDIDFFKSMKLTFLPEGARNSISKRAINKSRTLAVKTIKSFPTLDKSVGKLARHALYKQQLQKLPDELYESWKRINSIDSQIWPTKDIVTGIRYHPLSFDQHNTKFGRIYKKLVDQVSARPDYLFLVPKLSTGGTERLLFNYIDAIKKAHPDWHIAILSPLPKNHPYIIPKGVDFIDFEGPTEGIDWHERDVLWSRLLIQLGVKRLHIINHEGWYRWVASHEKLMAENGYIINASMFMREYSHEPNRVRTFAEPYLSDIYPNINKVFTDNQNIIDDMVAMNAFSPDKLVAHYQPTPTNLTAPKSIAVSNSKPLRIFWASRLSFQKRPDLVKKIAEQLDPQKFHIDIYGREQHYTGRYFNGLNSVTYKGAFSGIETIPTDQYDVYLYTSSVDGLPNILLEVAALGIPIVASNDGGVSELVIDHKTGLLSGIEDVDGYIKAFEYIRENPEVATNFAIEAQALLAKQHSLKKFQEEVARDIQ